MGIGFNFICVVFIVISKVIYSRYVNVRFFLIGELIWRIRVLYGRKFIIYERNIINFNIFNYSVVFESTEFDVKWSRFAINVDSVGILLVVMIFINVC